MRVIALEEAFATPFERSTLPPPNQVQRAQIAEARARLAHDVAAELLDLGVSRLAHMDAAGVDFQVLSLTVPGAQGHERETAIAVARDANEAAQKAVETHPQRFAAFAALPTPDVAESVKELERCVAAGFKGALVNGHTRGEYLDAKAYWPILECAQALQVPIYLHPSLPHPLVMKAYFEGYEELARASWGFGIDTGMHFLRMLFAGVFDAFPRLTVILGHLGEGIPFVLERLNNHGWPAARERGLKRTPAEYVRGNMVVTTSGNFSVPAFVCTAQVLGIENVLFSIDWPYEDNLQGTRYLRQLPIGQDELEKVAHGNAERVLKL